MSKYDKSFKEEAVRLALTSAQSTSKTVRDLGIKENVTVQAQGVYADLKTA